MAVRAQSRTIMRAIEQNNSMRAGLELYDFVQNISNHLLIQANPSAYLLPEKFGNVN